MVFETLIDLKRAKLNSLANQYQLDDLKDDISLSVANAYFKYYFE